MRTGNPLVSDASKICARADETGPAQKDFSLSAGGPTRKSANLASWLAASSRRSSSRARELDLWIAPAESMITSASPLESKRAVKAASGVGGIEGWTGK